jgi:hypothetical protein
MSQSMKKCMLMFVWLHALMQGCVAEYGVVMANLVLSGKSLGPHAFVMQV